MFSKCQYMPQSVPVRLNVQSKAEPDLFSKFKILELSILRGLS